MGGQAPPKDESVHRRMQSQATQDTQCERLLRSELHRAGLRFRVHRRPVPEIKRTADIVFGPAKVAVFVNGCFWHGCPKHATWPKTNADFWRDKIENNRRRDRETEALLGEQGWMVVTVWEHEDPSEAAERVRQVVRQHREVS